MSIPIHCLNKFKLFSCTIIIIVLNACTEDITIQEQSQNYNIPIPTNTIIRVIADRSIMTKDPFSDYNWNYITQAKIKTEKIFTHFGYSVVDTGLAPENKGRPTLIAIVKAQQDPRNKNSIHYSMNLYKPLSPNNSLLSCDTEQQSHNICIAPPKITDSQQLFTANCTYSGSANVASFIIEYCVKSAFNTYPQGSNKRIVYTRQE
ncbi:hypothetical protein [Commensalibacter papalotli (ex Botero et al. 2024)]|uniref:Lipoprotein n=1 Tax=Commensalibacter papalotli (ex Botero et al. 2024) TaxID=2972766 RepID=A0ABN8WD64_9PROT|nr:hypothetical protein [Commensalibacter papalotli (ex Botero et al. 2024)]CAI3957433.1 unnamed protein product [Commensalibacter papalotli (ex Botero et al. 2024)]CAI3957657.1 unnamed protein product [Commensalibacter papalotli (ex Botero et al. 2024)]